MVAHTNTNLDEKDLYTGSGLTPSVSIIISPSDHVALVERLDILMTSKAAGNAGVRNELVSLCDELLRQKLIDKHKYKMICCNYKNADNKKILYKEIRYWRSWYLRFHREFFWRECLRVMRQSN